MIPTHALQLSYAITTPSKTRIAIIGSGMAGLSSAWLLSQQGFNVTILEKGSRPGLAAHSRDFSEFIPDAQSELHGDIPSRMFNESLWPAVTQLYRDSGVEFEEVDHQQTFYRGEDVLLKIGLPYSPGNLLDVFNPTARRLAGALSAFQKSGVAALSEGTVIDQTFGEYLAGRFPDQKFDEFLNRFHMREIRFTQFPVSHCTGRFAPNYRRQESVNAHGQWIGTGSAFAANRCHRHSIQRYGETSLQFRTLHGCSHQLRDFWIRPCHCCNAGQPRQRDRSRWFARNHFDPESVSVCQCSNHSAYRFQHHAEEHKRLEHVQLRFKWFRSCFVHGLAESIPRGLAKDRQRLPFHFSRQRYWERAGSFLNDNAATRCRRWHGTTFAIVGSISFTRPPCLVRRFVCSSRNSSTGVRGSIQPCVRWTIVVDDDSRIRLALAPVAPRPQRPYPSLK